jgi:putative flippase GtrA
MTPARSRMGPFVAVGAAGFVVQLASLHALVSLAGVHYLLATGLAVEAAILNNFAWHSRWTWRDRPRRAGAQAWARLVKFNGLSALSSIVGNVLFTGILVATTGMPVLMANAVAVALVAAINFAGLDRWVFAPAAPGSARRIPTAAVLAALSLCRAAHRRDAPRVAALRGRHGSAHRPRAPHAWALPVARLR